MTHARATGARRPGGWIATAIISTATMAALMLAMPAHGAQELLLNHDLSKGAGETADSWQTEAWVNEPSAVTFHWIPPTGGAPGTLEVDALKENDARWMESLQLPPGWYYISSDIRTENIGAQNSGATISVLEDGIMSPEVKGTSDWTRVGMYLRVGAKGADLKVALRIGGFGSMNTGRAFFRNPSVIAVAGPPPSATPTYDLDVIRKAAQPVPIGSPISLVLTYIALATIALWGWRTFAQQPPKLSRAELRRVSKKAARR